MVSEIFTRCHSSASVDVWFDCDRSYSQSILYDSRACHCAYFHIYSTSLSENINKYQETGRNWWVKIE